MTWSLGSVKPVLAPVWKLGQLILPFWTWRWGRAAEAATEDLSDDLCKLLDIAQWAALIRCSPHSGD